MYHIVYTKQALKDINNLKAAGLSKKAKDLVSLIKENPLKAPPAFEALVGNLEGYYSRRINIQHRLVYQIINEPFEQDELSYEGTVKVIRMWTHYEGIK